MIMDTTRFFHLLNGSITQGNLQRWVKQDLKQLGIKLPKDKKTKKLNLSRVYSHPEIGSQTGNSGTFGIYLGHVKTGFVDGYGLVPTFLVEAAKLIESDYLVEGLFRKSGSIARQKEIKAQVDAGQSLQASSVHDVTVLFKQFFRQLPEPLLSTAYHDSFIRCFNLGAPTNVEALMLLCLMLPSEHILTLRFVMCFLSRLAGHSSSHKMDVTNLAVVLTPNIMHMNSHKMNSTEKKLLQTQTSIVELLIRKAERIGGISDSLYDRISLMVECFGTDEDLDGSDENVLEDSKAVADNHKSRRKRSGSLQGIVSSIRGGLSKLRRNSDGRNNLTASSVCSLVNDSDLTSASHQHQHQQSQSLSVPPSSHDVVAELLPMVTPVVMRKRKNEESAAFSATKRALTGMFLAKPPFSGFAKYGWPAHSRKAILDRLPQGSALASTPFTPASARKASKEKAVQDTPNLTFEETPHDEHRTGRRRFNLFSPSVSRKPRRSKSSGGGHLCGSALRKSSRTNKLLMRLSGGRPKSSSDEHVDVVDASLQRSHLSNVHHSSYLSRSPDSCTASHSVSSPSVHDTSMDDVTVSPLNQGFIDPETASLDAAAAHHHHSSQCRDSRSHSRKSTRRSASADGALRRGQPNKLCNGLLDGKLEMIGKLRSVLDKSDPSFTVTSQYPQQGPHGDPAVRVTRRFPTCFGQRSYGTDNGGRATKVMASPAQGNNLIDNSKTAVMDSSLMHVILPPPSSFADHSMMQVNAGRVGSEGKNVDGSFVAGFITVSRGALIHETVKPVPVNPGQRECNDVQDYGRSVSASVANSCNLTASSSADSLVSAESGSVRSKLVDTGGLAGSTVSIDSGKGSLTDFRTVQLQYANYVSGRHQVAAGRGSWQTDTGGTRSSSVIELPSIDAEEKTPTRSHSMDFIHRPSATPNLQISADTHRLLHRAGYLDSSLPLDVQDVAVGVATPQCATPTSALVSVDRSLAEDNRKVGRSFRCSRPSPGPVHTVTERGNGGGMRDSVSCPVSVVDAQSNVWVKREDVVVVGAGAHGHCKVAEFCTSVDDCSPEAQVGGKCRVRQAEMRLRRRDSLLAIKERNAGQVAENVKHIHSQLGIADPTHRQVNKPSKRRGLSPVRIPTVFTKDAEGGSRSSASHFKDLAFKVLTGHVGRPAEAAGDNSLCCGKRNQVLDHVGGPCLGAEASKCQAVGSPLCESTNKARLAETEFKLRTSKGLTPHKVVRYGPKMVSSSRSPGKPVKRLQDGRSAQSSRSPQRSLAARSVAFKMLNFHERY